MAHEFKHGSVGSSLTEAEWIGIGTHVLDSQATGDIIYASSASQLRRLGIGSTGHSLQVVGGVPSWVSTIRATTISYTDGDTAITIADGGGMTVAQNATFSGIVDITDATDSSDATGDTGALRTEGGASIAKKLYVGTDADIAGDLTLSAGADGALESSCHSVRNFQMRCNGGK
jgi:hypothetical protein